MGHTIRYTCLDCGKNFRTDVAGGFLFALPRCEVCGRPRTVDFSEPPLRRIRIRYLLGRMPHPAAHGFESWEFEECAEPALSEAEYKARISDAAGPCSCGGRFSLDAPVRCPRCRSADLEPDPAGPEMMYD